jgi:hypothetical protein
MGFFINMHGKLYWVCFEFSINFHSLDDFEVSKQCFRKVFMMFTSFFFVKMG